MKSYKIGIIGLGYVGFPLACLFAKKYPTVGYDPYTARVESLNAGIDTTGEIGSETLKERLATHLICTANPEDAKDCNVYIVAVPTPIDLYQQPDLTALREASQTVGALLKKGDIVSAGSKADIKPGNALKLKDMPVGVQIHNIELQRGKGGQLVRSAGTAARLVAKEGTYCHIELPSGELRLIHGECMATVGEVGNSEHNLVNIGKAGRARHMGKRPHVRGAVMNPVDHPHGGGEGKNSVGRKSPLTPWGKPALGIKTRGRKTSDKFIVRRRNEK